MLETFTSVFKKEPLGVRRTSSQGTKTVSQFRDGAFVRGGGAQNQSGRAQANSDTGIDNKQTQSHRESQSGEQRGLGAEGGER